MKLRAAGLLVAICLAGFLVIASPSSAFAAAGDFSYSAGSGEPQDWAGFGDSIMAGYCGLFCSSKSYASYYADAAAAENGWDVSLQSRAISGETTIQIYDEMANDHLNELRNADLVVWSAGGNDFLLARQSYGNSCDEAALDQAIDDWKADWDLIISLVSAEAAPEAIIRTMNIYYPDPNRDRVNFCGNVSDFEAFFPRLLEAGDYMCETAELAGFSCADSIAAMNCDEIDANHAIDPNCLDPSGSNFRDPLDVVKYVDGVPTSWPSANRSGMIQGDRIHPGDTGHRYIAAAHDALGYSDLPTGSTCGDSVCDPDESTATCPADCPPADVCGDGVCSGSEDPVSCSADCPDVCGDALCSGAEGTASCPDDCGSACGDGVCNGGENAASCDTDCPSVCGDSLCTGSEDTTSCTQDCGTLCGDGVCNGGEDTTSCTADCGTSCGDGVCNGDENEQSCVDDCGGPQCLGSFARCSQRADCCSNRCFFGRCWGN